MVSFPCVSPPKRCMHHSSSQQRSHYTDKHQPFSAQCNHNTDNPTSQAIWHSLVTVPIHPVHQTSTSHTTSAVLSTFGDERSDVQTYFNSSDFSTEGRLMTQAVTCQPHTMEAQFQYQTSPCVVYGRQSGCGTSFFCVLLLVPISIIPPILHTFQFMTSTLYRV